MTLTPPRLEHPGPGAVERLSSVDDLARSALIPLLPGRPLLSPLAGYLRSVGHDSAFVEFLPGRLSPVSYCVPTDGDGVERLVGYSEERHRDDVQLLMASATVGLRAGEAFMHCHALWRTPGGQLEGGHLWPGATAGPTPPLAVLTPLPSVAWTSADDPETRMPVFTPTPRNTHTTPGPGTHEETDMHPRHEADRLRPTPTVVARVLPNEDLSLAAERLCAERGWKLAVVRAGLGSLTGARFAGDDGEPPREVDGPGTEIVAVTGTVRADPGAAGALRADLAATLVDKHGRVHAGRLLRGLNPVAVTFELTLQRV
ncbi:PCC domain-containing protein [Galactobacter valiniphilus]|uniref:PCC domain-containing protein n=1 Tax=Galactobacter valiniphilus TaxID=2676122 RepID=UPI003735F3D5